MNGYAKGTEVSVDRSIAEIRATVTRFGADGFMQAEHKHSAGVMFSYQGRTVRMSINIPDRSDKRFWVTPGRGKRRTEEHAYREWEKECRRQWRGLALVIKALLVAVQEGVLDFDQAFMPHLLSRTGQTVGEMLAPSMEKVIKEGGKALPFGLLGRGKEGEE